MLPVRGRDLDSPTEWFKPGPGTARRVMYRGHQLSGLTFLREETVETYTASDCRNIYPFMYFLGFNSMRGRTLALTKPPVKGTTIPQSEKDWDYGEDGLFSERSRNAKALFRKHLWRRIRAELAL